MLNGEKQKDEQFKSFTETAREFGCGEDKERFEELPGKIAAYKPPAKGMRSRVEKPNGKRKLPNWLAHVLLWGGPV